MLKTAGHVKKYYKSCCILYEDFKNRQGDNATLKEYMKFIKNTASVIQDDDERQVFKGDQLEILAEIFFKAFSNSPQIGLSNYEPVPLEKDYGVDGFGINAAGKKCAVQIKHRSNPKDLVSYSEMARTYTSALIQLDIPLEGNDCLYVFTTAFGVTIPCKTVFGKKLRVINRDIISNEINNNVNFWELAYKEIKETLLAGNQHGIEDSTTF